ncbi:MAG: hypothetical protein Q9196_004319 [Gyalolechia fulgens]
MAVIFWLFFFLLAADVSAGLLALPVGARPWGDVRGLNKELCDSSAGSNAQCFATDQFHGICLKPIHYYDCIRAAERATFGGKAGAPMHFSRHPKMGMELPEVWSYGSCVIRIDMKSNDDEDTFPMNEVANAASLIAEWCSKPDTPGLGGIGAIGPKKVVMIFVYGRLPPAPPKPRPTTPPRIASFETSGR